MSKKYIFLNPVVCSLYDVSYLERILKEKGFDIVYSNSNNIDIVRNKYAEKCSNSCKCIIDSRCPKIKEYINTEYFENADINPILIETALEIHGNLNNKENSILYITTPCSYLRDLGNELKLENTIFITWKDFLKENNIILDSLKKKELNESPIPLGFFDKLKRTYKVHSVSGEDAVAEIFKNNIYKDNDLIEALYCSNGCHNGDGV